ncbi:LysR substrate-binding domain-containing protein [Sphingopyxis sp. JAI128]|uniref:LysR substrate-binding domain-containing protein n=1 Tax=Sphingopyxis sp. JAI128 TaxID=2723066 RepID=UPI00161E48A3|nr:LysR substrate-binding domain-containing protein [Sphingopyxis sp. JAI128]MBB6426899.1 DNA-binding transcriptional LysR family regulator [Sphingopyxis sp. JAI128]
MHSFDNLPPFDAIVAALAAAEERSFSGAAERLALTHGSVSRRIAQLEHWLGAPVFERLPRGVAPTPAGQRFLADASRAVAMLQRSGERWRPRKGRSVVRLSVVPSIARLVLLPALADLQGDDLSIELIVEHRPSDVEAKESDIAIRYGRGRYEGVTSELLLRERLVPCASPGLAARIDRADPSSLLAHPLIHDSNPDHWRSWLRTQGIDYRPRAQDRRFEDYDLVLQAAAAGLGLAMLRIPTARDRYGEEILLPISEDTIDNPLAHYMVSRESEVRGHVLEARTRIRRLFER